MYDLILKDFKLNDNDILDVFPYGSRIYGTATEKSDYDFVVVCKKLNQDSDRLDSRDNPISITTYLPETFQELINQHKIIALECIFGYRSLNLKESHQFRFKLNLSKLRSSISEKCNKDWNQAKKRFSDSQGINPVTKEQYIRKVYEGKKSLFHCFRMLNFAKQIVSHGTIMNFSSCNDLWEEIMTNPSEDWNDYKEQYHDKYNLEMTEFRKVAPK